MPRIPATPLALGLAGLLPFLWGVLTMWSPTMAQWTASVLGPRFVGPYIQLAYGSVILSFMSGALWGFASRGTGAVAASGYALSVLPALWAFFFVGGGPVSAAMWLALGFVGILGLDWMFQRQGLAPPWWMGLRVVLTSIVVLTFLPVIF